MKIQIVTYAIISISSAEDIKYIVTSTVNENVNSKYVSDHAVERKTLHIAKDILTLVHY